MINLCRVCHRPLADHPRWTEGLVAESEGANYIWPKYLSNGKLVYAPLSPEIVGDYIGHAPVWETAECE